MSTKKLSRTILEAGSSGYGKVERQKSKRSHRAKQRKYLKNVLNDSEHADHEMAPKLHSAHKSPADNLGAVYRFLDSWIGHKWDKARSEMMKKFNPKSLPGYHIIYDHILRDVYPSEAAVDCMPWWRSVHEFYFVDNNGILRKEKRIKYPERNRFNFTQVSSWLGNRKITIINDEYHWLVYSKEKCQWKDLQKINEAYKSEGFVDGFQPAVPGDVPAEGKFKTRRPLNKKEVKYFNSLPRWLQDEILDQDPVYIKERKDSYWEMKEEEKSRSRAAYKASKYIDLYY